jgi:isoquinoline 1-oxidoreductase beta subunit
MTTTKELSRRKFLQASAGAATGTRHRLQFASTDAEGDRPGGSPRSGKPLPPVNAFLQINEDETVKVLLAHSEMGQGIWTTLCMLVAEELECDWSKIRPEHAPAAPPYAHTAFGMQMTGGSTTTWSEFERYRQVGAMAREMLIGAAAAQWKVDPKSCRAENGYVVNGDQKLSFGKLAAAANAAPPPKDVKLKDAKDWKIIGKPTRRLDSPEKVTGKAQFGMDVQFPGLMTAVVARSPVFGGKVKSFNADKAKAVPGVKTVVQVDSGVAVVAEHFWAAKMGRDALEVEWDLGAGAELNTPAMLKDFHAKAETPGLKAAAAGDVVGGLAGAKSKVEAEYDLPYLAHATMEPQNCTVRIGDGECEVWCGSQFQTVDQGAAAAIAGVKPENVKFHTPFLGGGFGRRATPRAQVVAEAVAVAKAAGMPVKTVWTREDDMHGGHYRPMFHHRIRVGLDDKGDAVRLASRSGGSVDSSKARRSRQ